MPVSSGLQKYFDSKRSKKGDMQQKFENLKGQIDPAFLRSFDEFHDKIMGIMQEIPEAEELIGEDLDTLDIQLRESRRRHNMQKAASIIEYSEN